MLKRELIKELKQRDFNPPRDEQKVLTLDFMIYLYKILYTYQIIGGEIMKENNFTKRIEARKSNDQL